MDMKPYDFTAMPADMISRISAIRNFFYQVQGTLSTLLIIVNTLFWFGPIMAVAFLKFLIPVEIWRKACGYILNGMAVSWISVNNFNLKMTKNIKWEVHGLEGLSLKDWYLVISNHQSWTDIVVLQKIFNRKIPFLKFFMKKELIWVPFLGVAWWALDFPFMKRYSSSFLKKNPHLKGKDIEITKKACARFKTIPVSIMNFVEGTRFTFKKHHKQGSPFMHLLRPKAGGIGFVLSTMGEQLHSILNVTIVYPEGNRSFWEFLCGKVSEVKVFIERIPITPDILGDYLNDTEFQAFFQTWINDLWAEKDRLISAHV
jgi:1-acyl-sn-glycerol-3-phosphate acyltransferase